MTYRLFLSALLLLQGVCSLNAQVHTSYLWHLEQPIYWPEQSQWEPLRMQYAWESQWLKWNNGNWYADGQQHPLNNVQEIFSNDDRKAVYQYRARDAVQSLLSWPEAGAQVNYSGCLIYNVNSLANAGQWGYSQGWQNHFVTARTWTTSGGKPRMDITGFTMHHALAPLLSDRVFRKQLQAHKHLYGLTFGSNPVYSKGYWPAECAFSVRNIKVLKEEGFEWSVIANSHLARTLADYPLQFGTSVCNIDPPNKADVVSTTGNNWWSGQIDGRGGAFAAPYCYQAHKAKYVDPASGQEYKLTVVPMCDLLSYKNGYALMGTGEIDQYIAPYNNNARPSVVLLAHDGDNAWGGGYDYYTNSVPGFASAAASKGYVPTTLQQFLSDHPVPDNALVHVEDGAWVNAENDWGHPQFINWLWPLKTSAHQFNPNGWTEDARNWAVLVAAENRVLTAEDLSAPLNISDIVYPVASSPAAAKAWHFLLPAYNSGYMYYGASLDMEVKPSLAGNIACGYANQVINAHPGQDNTPPTVFIPQRWPYNPGGTGFGPTYGYQQKQNPNNFWVWTFAYDVSGIQSVTLKYRVDDDGLNPLTDNVNDTYAGGPGVGPWQSTTMTERIFPTGNVTNNPEINFFILPDYIANQYHAEITGFDEQLVDYYVEAVDTKGNISRTPIQHVYVGKTATPGGGGGGGGGGTGGVSWTPVNPTKDQVITLTVSGAGKPGKLHWAVQSGGTNWQLPIAAYRPSGSVLWNGSGPAVETAFAGPGNNGDLTLQIGPFNNSEQEVSGLNFVIHFDDNTWNNNNGQDFFIPVSGSGGGGGGGVETVIWSPLNPTTNDTLLIEVQYAQKAGNLHWGITTGGTPWLTAATAYWPAGSALFSGSGPAVESPMSGPDANGHIRLKLGPFNQAVQAVEGVNFVIHYNDNTWNNNGGTDYDIPLNPAAPGGTGDVQHSAIRIYPNPCKDHLYVSNHSPHPEGLQAAVLNAQGGFVTSYVLPPGPTTLPTAALAPGLYLLRVTHREGVVEMYRFVKL